MHIILKLFIICILTAFVADPNKSMADPTSKKTHLEAITQAFANAPLDMTLLKDVYTKWLEVNEELLHCKNRKIANELIKDIVSERIAQIYKADAPRKVAEFARDRVWIYVAPIDSRAFDGAIEVLRSKSPSQKLREQARVDLSDLNELTQSIQRLPKEVRGSLDSMKSESLLDLHFILDPLASPRSLRLGNILEPKGQ